MCRWLAYSGNPVSLEDLLYAPKRSLIVQSLHSQMGAEETNGDGFGIGWYGAGDTPGIYHGIEPAWNDRNLYDLAQHIGSPLLFAHIRASTGGAVQETNCHPFRHGRWLFMHNGMIRDFHKVKRDLVLEIGPELYPDIEGSTDTEVLFHLALTFGLEDDPRSPSSARSGSSNTSVTSTAWSTRSRERSPRPTGNAVGVPVLQRGQVEVALLQHRGASAAGAASGPGVPPKGRR